MEDARLLNEKKIEEVVRLILGLLWVIYGVLCYVLQKFRLSVVRKEKEREKFEDENKVYP